MPPPKRNPILAHSSDPEHRRRASTPILIDWRIRVLFAVIGAIVGGFGVYTLRQFHHPWTTNPYYLTRAIAAAFLGAVCLIFSILPWNRMMANAKDD